MLGFFCINPSYQNYSDIITFLSIMIGFKITALAILFTSPLKKMLYDRRIKVYQTELHRLRDFYRHSLHWEVLCVILLFIIPNHIFTITLLGIEIEIGKYLLVFPIVTGTAFCFYRIYQELLTIFVYPTND